MIVLNWSYIRTDIVHDPLYVIVRYLFTIDSKGPFADHIFIPRAQPEVV